MNRQPSRTLLALTLILLATGLLVLSVAGYLAPVQGLVMRSVTGIQTWIALRFAALRDMVSTPRDVETLRQRNAELEAEVARLEQQVITLQEQVSEMDILSALLNYARTRPENRYVAANVIGVDVSPFLRSVWIASGSESGLRQGMPVVTERGLVGRVAEVFPTMSRVQLVLDPESSANVILQAARADGTLVAQPNGELWVEMIDQQASVQTGELVLTSGLGGGYPPDIPVGQVISVRRRDYELFQQAVIQPVVDFDRMTIVLVITNYPSFPSEATAP
jgi:rod shape-determining protein MreC